MLHIQTKTSSINFFFRAFNIPNDPHKMAPSLEYYEDISVGELPIKAIPTKINGVEVISGLQLDQTEKHDIVLKTFRAFIADLCQQFGGGHPG